MLVELFADAGTPPGFVNLLYGNTVGPALVRDARIEDGAAWISPAPDPSAEGDD